MEEGVQLDLVPLGLRLFVKRKECAQIGRIIVPKTSQEMKPTEGRVISVGSSVTLIKPGDDIYFGRYSGFILERNGSEFICMNEEDIIAKVDSNAQLLSSSDINNMEEVESHAR